MIELHANPPGQVYSFLYNLSHATKNPAWKSRLVLAKWIGIKPQKCKKLAVEATLLKHGDTLDLLLFTNDVELIQ